MEFRYRFEGDLHGRTNLTSKPVSASESMLQDSRQKVKLTEQRTTKNYKRHRRGSIDSDSEFSTFFSSRNGLHKDIRFDAMPYAVQRP